MMRSFGLGDVAEQARVGRALAGAVTTGASRGQAKRISDSAVASANPAIFTGQLARSFPERFAWSLGFSLARSELALPRAASIWRIRRDLWALGWTIPARVACRPPAPESAASPHRVQQRRPPTTHLKTV